MFTKLILCLVLPIAINAAYNKFFWQDLGSKQIRIDSIDVVPMPIVQPGEATLTFTGETLRAMNGALKADINIIRTVAGLALPVRCYLATLPSGTQVNAGSCVYDDLCKIIETLLPDQFNPAACPASVADYGIDCICPFKLKKTVFNFNELLSLPDATASGLSFLANGDLDITIISSDASGEFAKVKIGFTVKSAASGK